MVYFVSMGRGLEGMRLCYGSKRGLGNSGDFRGLRATERYFLRLAVQLVENEKNLKPRENTGLARGKMVSAEGIEPSTY